MKTSVLVTVSLLGLAATIASFIVLDSFRIADDQRTTTCQGCLTTIAIAMHNYHTKYGHFPPAFLADSQGKPIHSWRALLLEFLDPDLYAKYKWDEPWNGPNNRKLEAKMPRYYACPADNESRTNSRTNYFVVIGEDTLFPGPKTRSLDDIKKSKSSTILVVESIDLNVSWLQPTDLSYDSMSFVLNNPTKAGLSSKHRRGVNVCFVDATKQLIDNLSVVKLQEILAIR